MRYVNQGRFRQQVRFLQCQFLQRGDLPFTNVLSQDAVEQALTAIGICVVDRIADRPDRVEPRLRKRRPKHYGFLRKPRREVQAEMLKRFRTK